MGLSLVFPLAVKADVNDALLQKLVEKGTITSEEAEEVFGVMESKVLNKIDSIW